MTIKIIDAAFETTTTTGTGDITLSGALAGFRPFSSAGNGAFVAYQINDGNAAGVVTQREVGIGIVTVGNPNTLKRSKILYSTNSNQAVNFGAGTKNVLGNIPADILAVRDENLNFLEGFGTGGGTATAQTITLPTIPLGYSDGMRVYYYPTITNTGAFTINVNGLGNKPVKFAGVDPVAGFAAAGIVLSLVYNATTGFFSIQPNGAMTATGPVGQCRLIKSGANLLLKPLNGNRLTISGLPQLIPDTGVSLAVTGLTAVTLYYIYAYMSNGVMTLEASTTGHGTEPTTGVEVKIGDPTRTLVGMARPIAGPAWQDTAQQRFVISYFNRRSINTGAAFTGVRSTNSGSFVELNAEIRNEFLTWADEIVEMSITGGFYNSGGYYSQAAIGFNGAAVEPDTAYGFGTSNSSAYTMVRKAGLAEGYNYSIYAGRSGNSAGTAAFGNADIAAFNRMTGAIRG